jgi:hypothetical protein
MGRQLVDVVRLIGVCASKGSAGVRAPTMHKSTGSAAALESPSYSGWQTPPEFAAGRAMIRRVQALLRALVSAATGAWGRAPFSDYRRWLQDQCAELRAERGGSCQSALGNRWVAYKPPPRRMKDGF